MPNDISNNCSDISNNKLIVHPNQCKSGDTPKNKSKHSPDLLNIRARRLKINSSITDLIKRIKKDIENTESTYFRTHPTLSRQVLENSDKNDLDASSNNITTMFKNVIDSKPQLNKYTPFNSISPLLSNHKPNAIKYNAPTDINMKINDLIQRIKLDGKHLERSKPNKNYTFVKNFLDNNSNDKHSLPSHSSTIVSHKQQLTHRNIDSLSAHIDTVFDLKYSRSMFHGNKIFDSVDTYRNLLQRKTAPNMRIPLHIQNPTTSASCVAKKKVNIEVEINSLEDLLKLIDDNPIQYDIEYNIDMEAMHKIKKPLIELNNMIGMNKLKNSIVDQVIYFIQGLHQSKVDQDGDFMHTCIYGPPGTGKTEVAKIMGNIFSNLGVLKKNVFRKVTRADLIAGYLGQTSLKTRDIVKECLGGVMFIDEAYALGNAEKRDSFAKECIDTLCEALSDHKHDLMVIIAGYEHELKKCFFAYNQGLDSRFTWRFKTDDYNPAELRDIFIKKVKDAGWTIEKNSAQLSWFETNIDYFKFFGRDMETLFSKIKIAHSRRVFCLSNDKKKCITDKDLERGFSQYLDNGEVKCRKDEQMDEIVRNMYV